MKEQELEPLAGQLDAEVLQKLDGGLRRLLRMTDDEILEAVERVKTRQEERLAYIRETAETVEKEAAGEELVEAQRVRQMVRAALAPHRIFGAVIIEDVVPVAIKAEAHVQFVGNRDDLLALGLEVRSHAQDVFIVVGTTAQLTNLAAQPATLRLQLPLPEEPTVEDAAQQAEIDQAHAPWSGTPAGYHGNNVIVGIIDTPLDVTHATFRENTGAHDTRVRYMWVQRPSTLNAAGEAVAATPHATQQSPHAFHNANPGTTPDFTGLTDGVVYTDADINTAFAAAGGTYGTNADQICCEPRDREHGTHVAGIAAGDGANSAWATTAHVGAADQATIVHVSHTAWTSTRIQDALAFIFAVADHLNLPVAVNISLGGNWGPHIGNMPRDRFIDAESDDDDERVVVGTAGNGNRLGDAWGRGDGFRTGTITAGNTEMITMTSTSAGGHDVSLDIWYTGPELHFRVSMAGGGSTAAGTFTGAGSEFHGMLGTYDVDVDRQFDAEANMRQLRIDVDGARTADPLTVELHNPAGGGDVTYYGWVCSQAGRADLTGASNDWWTLSANACCRSSLTVGACAKLAAPAPAAGEAIGAYSGAGPTIDGRVKPEIVAVGGTSAVRITSADSTPGNDWTLKYATSMAAPLVTGAVALLLEAARLQGYSPNHDTIKAFLTQNANRLNINVDPGAAGYVDTERNLYGYGRLRMVAPLTQMRPPTDINLWVRTADDDFGDEPYIGDCFCGAPDIRVCDAGTTNETRQLSWGTPYDVRVTVRNLGDSNASNVTVRLKYTLPWAAPNDWVQAKDDSAGVGQDCERTNVAVSALDETHVDFTWQPRSGEISGAPAGQTHYCLLAEVDHVDDTLVFDAPSAGGGSAWSTNIKGTNNCALRNVHIQ
jgi:hypothetical protein